MTRVSRGERILEKLAARGALTPTGKDWLVAALDPMHDSQLQNLEGWPDVETTPSVVRCIKQSITVASPFGAGPNWDLHVVSWPWANQAAFCGTNFARSNNYVNVSSNQLPVNLLGLGGVQCFATPAGGNCLIGSLQVGTIDLAAGYLQGPCRLIGQGWEVINTTSDLNKQGQACVYRQPECRMEPQSFTFDNDVPVGGRINPTVADGQIFRPMPTTTAAAMLLPGTRQWAAAKGAYVAVPFVGQDNPPNAADYIQPLIHQDAFTEDGVTFAADAFVANNVGLLGVPTFTNFALTSGNLASTAQAQHLFPMHQTGAIFTGLSDVSTLTLTVNYYLESFPGPAEPGILVLATPSAQYDPIALELFSHCLGTLPVGVPAGDNLFGDWFAGVVKAASTYLGPIAEAMGYSGVAKGLSVASSMASGTYGTAQSPQGIPRLKAPSKNGPPKVPPRKGAAYNQEVIRLRAQLQAANQRNSNQGKKGRGGGGRKGK